MPIEKEYRINEYEAPHTGLAGVRFGGESWNRVHLDDAVSECQDAGSSLPSIQELIAFWINAKGVCRASTPLHTRTFAMYFKRDTLYVAFDDAPEMEEGFFIEASKSGEGRTLPDNDTLVKRILERAENAGRVFPLHDKVVEFPPGFIQKNPYARSLLTTMLGSATDAYVHELFDREMLKSRVRLLSSHDAYYAIYPDDAPGKIRPHGVKYQQHVHFRPVVFYPGSADLRAHASMSEQRKYRPVFNPKPFQKAV
jgi:hypothetical protein